MKVIGVIIFTALVLTAFLMNLFGLMRLYPIYITSPLLFLVIFFTIKSLFHRKKFKGFKSYH
ncbi:putative membrane protein YizD [Thalassobacillus devorans]|uniref:Membrane protein YizD n=1 Tax=Thalassobacillus devorans TaxID=279813 RepID=A0ABQ1NER3_9BACI|nr:hypothetical protein [Thalassobacillus devorans]NIK27082.1 hypothetical protein [Thalassobacillus devorans]GGC74786.1 putative membrane protein YizD [Thalassobacillus devorans]